MTDNKSRNSHYKNNFTNSFSHHQMQQIGIFGGSFNPIHNGHIALAGLLLEKAGLEEVWLMVSPQNPLKRQADLLDDDLRLEMARKALADTPRLVACSFEMELPLPSYTWRTMQALSDAHPDKAFTLIIGADNWEVFGQWAHHDDIMQRHPIIIFPRPGHTVDTASLPPNVRLIDTPLCNISSTEIRQRVGNGLPISGLVPDKIVPLVSKYYRPDNKG